jgi:hypothetical protein
MLGDRLDYRTALWIAVAGYLFVAAAHRQHAPPRLLRRWPRR